MSDLTLVGNIKAADGIGRHNMLFAKTLASSGLDINCKIIGNPEWKDIPKEAFATLAKPFNGYGKISLWTYIIGLNNPQLIPFHDEVVKSSRKAFTYSMIESDLLPTSWKDQLNKYAGVIVPDPFLVDVCKNSGVNKPIQVLPLPIVLNEFLSTPRRKAQVNSSFTFGCTASALHRKNFSKLIRTFRKTFPNGMNVKLKLHSRSGFLIDEIKKMCEGSNNIEFLTGPMSRKEYVAWMNSLDCYVFPSIGEGYSVCPRESIAAGIPTILLNHTAQKTICNSGFAISVPADIKVPARYEFFNNEQYGNFFDCEFEDLQKALVNVVNNYDFELEKVNSKESFEWVKQFTCEALAPKYTEYFKEQLASL